MVRREVVPRGVIDSSQTLGGFVRPSQVPDRNPVDSELLMPEWHRFTDTDTDNDNDCARCSTFY